ncbi:MAG: hypothetical protein QXU82_01335 [Candidatus Aenigmatarchaeota archaeon]
MALIKVKKLDQSTLEILCQRLVEAVNKVQEREKELEDILNNSEANKKEFRAGRIAKDTFKVDDAKYSADEANARKAINDAVNEGLEQIHALKMLVKAQEISLPGMPANKPKKKARKKKHKKAAKKKKKAKHHRKR